MDGPDGAWQGLGLGGGGGELGDRLRARGPRVADPRRGSARGDGLGAVPGEPRNRGGLPPWHWQDFAGEIWDPSPASGRSGCPWHCVIMHSLCRDCLNLLPPEPADDEDFGARLNYWLAKEACASACKGYLDRCSGFFPDCPPIFERFIEDLRDDLPSEPAEPETQRDLSKCGADVTVELLDFLATLHDAIQAGATAPGLNELVCGLYAAERLGPEGDLNWKKEGKKGSPKGAVALAA